jgi:hypothetical protein
MIRAFVKELFARAGYTISRTKRPPPTGSYYEDGLLSIHDHGFVDDPRFLRAYARGVQSAGADYHWRWRVHVGLWAAAVALDREGDFVECGVNRGFLSSAIMNDLDWDRHGRTFYLLDTFRGMDETQLSEPERQRGWAERNRQLLENGFYVSGIEPVRRNFSEWRNVTLIEGSVPDSLRFVDSERIAFLHLDMNSARPEVAALEVLWDRLVPGALVLMDDYGYREYRHGRAGLGEFFERRAARALQLPTGQGLVIRPSA